MESLKDRIRAARTSAGLSQSALARLCGCGPSAINHLESGKVKTLSGPLLLAIGKALAVDATWLATGVGAKEMLTAANSMPSGNELLSALAQLDPDRAEYLAAQIIAEAAAARLAKIEARLRIKSVLPSHASDSQATPFTSGADRDQKLEEYTYRNFAKIAIWQDAHTVGTVKPTYFVTIEKLTNKTPGGRALPLSATNIDTLKQAAEAEVDKYVARAQTKKLAAENGKHGN